MIKNLREEFKRFEGQPVKIYTDDGRVHMGIDAEAYEDCVRIIDRCGRLFLIEYCHIDAVEEPQMELRRCHYHEPECIEGIVEDDDDCGCGCGRARCC